MNDSLHQFSLLKGILAQGMIDASQYMYVWFKSI